MIIGLLKQHGWLAIVEEIEDLGKRYVARVLDLPDGDSITVSGATIEDVEADFPFVIEDYFSFRGDSVES